MLLSEVERQSNKYTDMPAFLKQSSGVEREDESGSANAIRPFEQEKINQPELTLQCTLFEI